jgi:hypothetical protein
MAICERAIPCELPDARADVGSTPIASQLPVKHRHDRSAIIHTGIPQHPFAAAPLISAGMRRVGKVYRAPSPILQTVEKSIFKQ